MSRTLTKTTGAEQVAIKAIHPQRFQIRVFKWFSNVGVGSKQEELLDQNRNFIRLDCFFLRAAGGPVPNHGVMSRIRLCGSATGAAQNQERSSLSPLWLVSRLIG